MQKKDQKIHAFTTNIKQLFDKMTPHPRLEWKLRKTNENLRI